MDIVQDFWNVPVYNELIASTAQQLGEALDGKKLRRTRWRRSLRSTRKS